MLNLDTHILLYALVGKVTKQERAILSADQWGISAIVLWEIAKLRQLGRVVGSFSDRELRRVLAAIQIWPITWDVCQMSTTLDFTSDPADELIASTSIVYQAPLLSRDKIIRRSKLVPFPS